MSHKPDTEGRVEIWYLISSLDIGGAERTLVDLVTRLDREQFEPTIWTLQKPGPLADAVPSDVTIRSLDASFKGDPRVPLRFVSALFAERPSILQSFLYFDNALACLAGIPAPSTTVITGVRGVREGFPRHRELIVRGTVQLSDRIVSNSNAGAEYIHRRGADPERIVVIKNGRDPEVYAAGRATDRLYQSLDLNTEAPIVGTVGRLIKQKGHYDLIDAWPTVLERHPQAQLLIVGDGPDHQSLVKHASSVGCADSIVFAGRRGDVPDLLDAMDVFVFPSYTEGLPGALLEAMLAGLPVVTTPAGGSSELVEDEVTGLFIPPGQSTEISKKLILLLEDEDMRRHLGNAAREFSREEFGIDRMVEDFDALYEDVLRD